MSYMSHGSFDEAKSASDLARAYLDHRESLASSSTELGGVELMSAYSDLTDALVTRVYEIASEGCAPEDLAVAAVGGYGRREMSPFSDVDVTFIVGDGDEESIEPVVKRAFRLLMDVLEQSGINVGYSYRRMDEIEDHASGQDAAPKHSPLETQTALLDARRVVGSAALFDAFEAALRRAIVPAQFVIGHIESRGGHPPFPPLTRGGGGGVFVVEPDVKEGVGGLRDLHAARWVAEVAFKLDGGDVWEGLRSRGVVTDDEVTAAEEAREFLSRTRNALHLLAGRALEVISAERRPQVAERLGLESERTFAAAYYSHAHRLRHIYGKVAAAALGAELEIEPGMTARDGRLLIRDRGLLARDPAALLRAFGHAQDFRLSIPPETGDLIAAGAAAYKPASESNRTFLDILSRPGSAAALRSMADLGVLQVVIPQFGAMMYDLPEDAAHRFTVGEHCLRTVEELEALFQGGDERFADVFSRIQSAEVLFFAALMHDSGKTESRRDHSRTGAARATALARSLGMSDDGCAKVEFLVRHHLKMAETARLRDLGRPKTIRDFVAVVNDPQVLDMLFLLTVADNRAVGAVNWSRVQLRFLVELQERAAAALRSPAAAAPDIDRHRTRVRRELRLANLPADLVDEHCESMPAAYLLNTPPEELAAHIGYVRAARKGSPVVDLRDDRAGEFTVLTVVTTDRTGLLADIAGVMHALGIDIHAAQIFTRSSTDRIAIDTIYIDFEGRQLAEIKKWQVEGELVSVLKGELGVQDLLARLGKREFTRPVLSGVEGIGEAQVAPLDNLSEHESVVEIRAPDAPGLLYYLTRTIAGLGWNIHSARVATWGHEARDVFYVTDRAGCRLDSSQLSRLRDQLRSS